MNAADPGAVQALESGLGESFEADGALYWIDQPTTEEYDDAMAIEQMVMAHWRGQPEMAALAEQPVSDGERSLYRSLIEDANRRASEARPGSATQQAAQEEAGRLQRTLAERSLADEVAGRRALLARDRYLCQRLLCDADGQRLLDWRTPGGARQSAAAWERISLRVKNAARPAIWRVIAGVRAAPFP